MSPARSNASRRHLKGDRAPALNRLVTCGLIAGCWSLCVSCSSVLGTNPQPSLPVSDAAQQVQSGKMQKRRLVQLAQLGYGSAAHFALCAEPACPHVTIKTWTRAEIADGAGDVSSDVAADAAAPSTTFEQSRTSGTRAASQDASQAAAAQAAAQNTGPSPASAIPTADSAEPWGRSAATLPPVAQNLATERTRPDAAVLSAGHATKEPAPLNATAPPETSASSIPPNSSVRLHLNFTLGSANLTSHARRMLRSAMPQAWQAQRIVIHGRTDDVGSSEINETLAFARALAVRDFLRDEAPDLPGVIAIDAKGRCCFVASNHTEQGRALNRRVEVVLIHGNPSRRTS